MSDIQADVVIVGSGVAGALVAERLARAGVRVAILEAGPRIDRGEALWRYFRAPFKTPESPYAATPEADFPLTIDPGPLVPSVGSGLVQEHLPESGGRHHLALAGHLPAALAERFSVCEAATDRVSTGL